MPRKACSVSRVDPKTLWTMFVEKFKDVGDGYVSPYEFDCLGPKFQADFGKVDFDFENYSNHAEDEFGIWKGMLGPQKLWTSNLLSNETSFSYIGWMAGGDWEQPVYFIIYLDKNGKTFRAYIPKDGNVWNHKTKQAFGNDEDADDAFLRKWIKKNCPDRHDTAWKATSKTFGKLVVTDLQYGSEDADIMFDKEKITEEIMARFEAVP